MAKVATKWLVWVSHPRVELGETLHDRIEVAMDSVVPDTIPMEVQQEWEAAGYIYEDPTKEHVEKSEGPPRVSLPPVLTQQMEHKMYNRKMSRGIPPRPTPQST